MLDILAILALLIGLELVLGVDNILVITIFVSRLKKNCNKRLASLDLL